MRARLRLPTRWIITAMLTSSLVGFSSARQPQPQKDSSQKKTRLPPARQLDKGVRWQRDSATGELRAAVLGDAGKGEAGAAGAPSAAGALKATTQMVPVTCIVSTPRGEPVPGLRREDFRLYEDGAAQPIAYFDASTQPASVALVIDASPSVLRDSAAMHQAADALIESLAPLDQAAVVGFSAHTYLQTPFSDTRELVRRAVARVDPRDLLADTGGSNIYQAVYLAARDLFAGRTGRKAIVLLTDGQDSGLGLTLDPATMAAQPGQPANRLTFDDVARLLAQQDIQLFAVSTENRPKIMTLDWLAAHTSATLVDASARASGIPPYTLFLAELVRRAGGQLYFLNEADAAADTFRQIAEKIRSDYTLGFYPAGEGARPGWHSLHVELVAQPGARASHRAAYYVPAAQ
jgi:Ca-activated chloride channel homolog